MCFYFKEILARIIRRFAILTLVLTEQNLFSKFSKTKIFFRYQTSNPFNPTLFCIITIAVLRTKYVLCAKQVLKYRKYSKPFLLLIFCKAHQVFAKHVLASYKGRDSKESKCFARRIKIFSIFILFVSFTDLFFCFASFK